MSITELTGIDVPTGLLIGGEWGKGAATFPVLRPGDRGAAGGGRRRHGERRARRGERRAGRAARLGGDPAAAAGRGAAQGVRADDARGPSSSPG